MLQNLSEVNAILGEPSAKARIAELGGDVFAGSPPEFARIIAADAAKWSGSSGRFERAASDVLRYGFFDPPHVCVMSRNIMNTIPCWNRDGMPRLGRPRARKSLGTWPVRVKRQRKILRSSRSCQTVSSYCVRCRTTQVRPGGRPDDRAHSQYSLHG